MFCLYIVHYFLSSMEDINAFKSSRVSGVTVRSEILSTHPNQWSRYFNI